MGFSDARHPSVHLLVPSPCREATQLTSACGEIDNASAGCWRVVMMSVGFRLVLTFAGSRSPALARIYRSPSASSSRWAILNAVLATGTPQ